MRATFLPTFHVTAALCAWLPAQGTVQLAGMPKVGMTCRALGVDYATAMVGFDVRGGGSVPVFDGVVVCEEHAQAVRDAYWAAEECASHLTPL